MRSALYEGSTWHARRGPVENSFRYDVWTWLLDLDELDQLDRELPGFGVDRRAPVTLRAEDHLVVEAGRPWKDSVVAWLGERGVTAPVATIALQTTPRVLGYTFNPLSLWWCRSPDDELVAVIAEVHNTYDGRHAYLLTPDAFGRVDVAKELYVSPFYSVDGTYRMRLSPPRERFDVHIGYDREGARVFDATWSGERRRLDGRAVARLLLTRPWSTLRIITLIHLQGVKLWLRGLGVFPRTANTPEGTPR